MATNIIKQMAKKPQTVALIIAVIVVAFILVFSTSGAAAKFYAAKDAKLVKSSEAKPISTQPKIRTVQNAPLAAGGCTDSDGGKIYTLRGEVEIDGAGAWDICKDPNEVNKTSDIFLGERFCDNTKSGIAQIGLEYFDCSSIGGVCKDGACV